MSTPKPPIVYTGAELHGREIQPHNAAVRGGVLVDAKSGLLWK